MNTKQNRSISSSTIPPNGDFSINLHNKMHLKIAEIEEKKSDQTQRNYFLNFFSGGCVMCFSKMRVKREREGREREREFF